MCVQGVQQPGIFREFDLPQGEPGKPGKLRELFCLSMRIFYGLLFELLPDNDRKIICRIILVSNDINDCKKNSGNFVEIVPGKPGNLREFCVGNWVDTLVSVGLPCVCMCISRSALCVSQSALCVHVCQSVFLVCVCVSVGLPCVCMCVGTHAHTRQID